jgi:hypothetical protein
MNPSVVAGSRRLNRSEIMNTPWKKIGLHHFRFPVPPQADCCYFHGVAESRFLNKAFFRKNLLGHEK